MPAAPRNRTLTLTATDRALYAARLAAVDGPVELADVLDRTILGDALAVLAHLPADCCDLVFLDPPYNLPKRYAGYRHVACPPGEYARRMSAWLTAVRRVLKPDGSLYVCADWRSANVVQSALAGQFVLRNRITWEREKGRAARRNWKSCAEDIWFATVGDNYVFHADAVRLRRAVRAPYRDAAGRPKDWREDATGAWRETAASNLWTDLTVPFWSMPENTPHPTQKPEKLLARIILASSEPGAVVLDPFAGSGTAAVVARKLGRHFIAIEREDQYACLCEKRLAAAAANPEIQGLADGVFWERNSAPPRRAPMPRARKTP